MLKFHRIKDVLPCQNNGNTFTIQCLVNENYLLETHLKFFREKSKRFLLGSINVQVEHKIKELTTKRPSVQSLISAVDGFH